ncbi:MAG: TauD/TfdA family dioxygenase [Rhizobiales bacterium]|nr:TauD/TfdA family dioxygenase [Hyphomicrobiales bacterium]
MVDGASGVRTRPLNPHFGVEVEGLKLSDVASGSGYEELRGLFEEHSALLFRAQDITDEQHLALARRFGVIEDRKADERKPGETVGVSHVTNVQEDGSLSGEMDLHTLHLKANFLWHIDSTFLPSPALTNILIARVVTTSGGATELASTRAAFAAMPETMRERLRKAVFRHHYSHSRAQISPELAKLPMFHKWPEQRWRAVVANPLNGAEAIYVASHVWSVEGMEEAEGRRFVREVLEFCTQPRFVYSHNWTPGDVLIWDQRAVLHRGTPWPWAEPRKLASLCVTMSEADGLAALRPALAA